MAGCGMVVGKPSRRLLWAKTLVVFKLAYIPKRRYATAEAGFGLPNRRNLFVNFRIPTYGDSGYMMSRTARLHP
jgi:hypothetical protein